MWLDRGVQSSLLYGSERNSTRSVLSIAGIDREAKKAEFGIFIGEEEWLGRGIGEEAAKLILDYGFEELGLHKIKLRVLADNKRAIASYRKAGFVEEGCFRDELLLDGKYCDLFLWRNSTVKK